MSRDPLPDPWRTALERRGIHSKRGLATKAGISPQTAKRLIDGEGQPSPETVAAVADAVFDGDRNRVWELAGVERQDHGDWQLPPEASQLNQEQRAAVLAVVRAMLPQQQGRGDGDDRDAASIVAVGHTSSEPIDFQYVRNMLVHGQGAILEVKGAEGQDLRTAVMQASAYMDDALARSGNDARRAGLELTERYLAEEIEDEAFLLAQSALRDLAHAVPAAARTGQSLGRGLRAAQDRAAEESQDPQTETT